MNERDSEKSSLEPVYLRCEYAVNPLGIDTVQPYLSWLYDDDESRLRNRAMSAYQILVADSTEILLSDRGNVWDSGKVECTDTTARPFQIPFAGKSLESGKRYFWKVRVWDESQHVSAYSEPAFWEMGLLQPGDWSARWIAYGDESEREAQTKEARPMPIFRKGFALDRPIRSARAYVCGLGHYELHLNGQRVGDYDLDPGWTNYRKTCLYSTFDVTSLLQTGENAIGVLLGNGMYNVPGGRYVKFTGSFGPPKLILQLDVTYQDGTRQRIASDDTWQAAPGPITFSCTYGGEDYDARLDRDGWDAPGFKAGQTWRAASVVEGPGGALRAQMAPPLTVMRVLQPVEIRKQKSGAYLYDFGQNFSGWMQITVQGKAGATVKLIPAEWMKDGEITQATSGQPSYFTYTLNGQGIEEWHPRFSFYGFRYVQVEGAVPAGHYAPEGTPVIQVMTGHYIYPQIDTIGNFTCSNILINQIHHIILEAILCNMKSVLTDCPHREKLGWLEENHLMGPSILYNFDVPALYRKIFNDISEAQLENGLVPDIAPEFTVFQGGFRDAPSWGSAYLIAPWYVYQYYGDRRNFADHYEGMKRYVAYLGSKAEGHIVSHGLGDWCDVGPLEYGPSQNTPLGVTGTAIYYYDVTILARAARWLGKEDDAAHFERLANAIREAFNNQFFNAETNQYATGSQTSNAMPLVLDMVPKDRIAAVVKNVVDDIRAHGTHTTAGDVGHQFVLQALAKYGRSDVVGEMALQTDFPSYGYQVKHGATTLTEVWNGPTQGNSQIHFMLGHIEEWFYRSLGGIDFDPSEPAFKRIRIKPHPVADVTWARTEYRSPYGWIRSVWKCENNVMTLDVEIPPDARAEVYLPTDTPSKVEESGKPISETDILLDRQENGYAVYKVGSGAYHFCSSH